MSIKISFDFNSAHFVKNIMSLSQTGAVANKTHWSCHCNLFYQSTHENMAAARPPNVTTKAQKVDVTTQEP